MKRFVVCIVISILLTGLATAQGPDAKRLAKSHETVQRIGTGPKAKVEVKLVDGSKIKGTIDRIDADSFTVNHESGRQTIAFTDVKEVKKPHSGLKPLTWVIIGAAATGAIIGIVMLRSLYCNEHPC